MARFSFVVYSNPAEGREQEYNDWYSNQHLRDLLAIPGVISARRFKLSDTQIGEVAQTYRYLAIYDIEADDVQSFIKELMLRTASGAIPRCGHVERRIARVLGGAIASLGGAGHKTPVPCFTCRGRVPIIDTVVA